jgi:hypothetical protein
MLDTRRCLDVNVDDLQQELDRKRAVLGEKAYAKLRTGVEALRYLEELVADQSVTMAELRRLIVLHGGTEKTADVLRQLGLAPDVPAPTPSAATAPEPRVPIRGHGRRGAAAYPGARRIVVSHETLRAGARCPTCAKGKVYPLKAPKRQIRFVGQAPLTATVYERERLRCNLCNEVFTAPAPAGLGDAKYDDTAVSTLGALEVRQRPPLCPADRPTGALRDPAARVHTVRDPSGGFRIAPARLRGDDGARRPGRGAP